MPCRSTTLNCGPCTWSIGWRWAGAGIAWTAAVREARSRIPAHRRWPPPRCSTAGGSTCAVPTCWPSSRSRTRLAAPNWPGRSNSRRRSGRRPGTPTPRVAARAHPGPREHRLSAGEAAGGAPAAAAGIRPPGGVVASRSDLFDLDRVGHRVRQGDILVARNQDGDAGRAYLDGHPRVGNDAGVLESRDQIDVALDVFGELAHDHRHR